MPHRYQDSIQDIVHDVNARGGAGRMDANETYFLARELEQILEESFPVEYEPLVFRDRIPVRNDFDAGASSITFRTVDYTGQAAIRANLSGEVPRADVAAAETETPVREVVMGYGYTVQDLRRAAMARRPLDRDRKMACMRGIEKRLQQIAVSGDTDLGLSGFINRSDVTTESTPNGSWLTSATHAEVMQDVGFLLGEIGVNTLDNWGINTVGRRGGLTLLMSDRHFAALMSLQDTTAGTSQSTLAALKATWASVGLEIYSWTVLRDAGAAGVERIIAYQRNESACYAAHPLEYTEYAPERRGFEWTIVSQARTAGVIAPYPGSIVYMDTD